jgi:hypothetical protein
MSFFYFLGELSPKNNSMNMLAGYMPKLIIRASAAPRVCIGRYFVI